MEHGLGMRDFEDVKGLSGDEFVVSPLAPGGGKDENVCGVSVASNDGSYKALDTYFYYCALENDYF